MPLAAQNENAGTTGFDTLKLFYNARTTAMGGAVNGIPKNADALDFNPAAILEAGQRSVATSVMDHLVGSGGGSVSYVFPKIALQPMGPACATGIVAALIAQRSAAPEN
jgi:hypothetical protein